MFKESLCPYGANDNGTCLDSQYAKATGNQVNFKNDLFNSTEPYEASGNIYLTYNLWDVSTWDAYRYLYDSAHYKPATEKKEEKMDDNSLLFMGLGVAGIGAAVIVVMAVRK